MIFYVIEPTDLNYKYKKLMKKSIFETTTVLICGNKLSQITKYR